MSEQFLNRNATSVLYGQGQYLNWAPYKLMSYDAYALSNSNINSTMVADIFYCSEYWCDPRWNKARDVPANQPIQIKRGYKVSGFLDALTVDEGNGLLALEIPNNDPRKFFNIIKGYGGFKLKSTYNNKYVVNQGNYFYARGNSDSEAYMFSD